MLLSVALAGALAQAPPLPPLPDSSPAIVEWATVVWGLIEDGVIVHPKWPVDMPISAHEKAEGEIRRFLYARAMTHRTEMPDAAWGNAVNLARTEAYVALDTLEALTTREMEAQAPAEWAAFERVRSLWFLAMVKVGSDDRNASLLDNGDMLRFTEARVRLQVAVPGLLAIYETAITLRLKVASAGKWADENPPE